MRGLAFGSLSFFLGCGPSLGGGGQTGTEGSSSGSGSGPMSSSTTTTTQPTGASTTTDTGSGTTQGSTATDTGCASDCSASTGVGACEVTEDFSCVDGVDCSALDCGDLFSPFDENGCLRSSCTEAACEDGFTCFAPSDYYACASSGTSCLEESGECTCASDPDCGGQYCVAEELAPPALCRIHDADETACAEAGCESVLGRPIYVAETSCVCDLAEPRCIWLQPGTVRTPGRATYFALSDEPGPAIVFEESFEPPPPGYASCDGHPLEDCGCAEVLPCAM